MKRLLEILSVLKKKHNMSKLKKKNYRAYNLEKHKERI